MLSLYTGTTKNIPSYTGPSIFYRKSTTHIRTLKSGWKGVGWKNIPTKKERGKKVENKKFEIFFPVCRHPCVQARVADNSLSLLYSSLFLPPKCSPNLSHNVHEETSTSLAHAEERTPPGQNDLNHVAFLLHSSAQRSDHISKTSHFADGRHLNSYVHHVQTRLAYLHPPATPQASREPIKQPGKPCSVFSSTFGQTIKNNIP